MEAAEALARGSSKAASEHADADLDRWVNLQPNQAEPLKLRLEYYRKQKDYERAYRDARQLLTLTPSDGALQRTAMNLAFSAGHFPEAEEICRELVKSQPRDTALCSLLAQIRRSRNDLPGAAAILDELLKEQPKLTSAMMSRAASPRRWAIREGHFALSRGHEARFQQATQCRLPVEPGARTHGQD